MNFPDFLEPYRAQGHKLFHEGAVRGFTFSGPTYQIEVHDPQLSDPLWVFLQFDDKLQIKDLFCSCEESTEKGACPHMAAACFFVFSKKNSPQHVRFAESLWQQLFYSLFEHSTAPKVQKRAKGLEVTSGDKVLFTIKGQAIDFQALQSLLLQKVEETEETSIKFSNLTDEEIEHWRKGRPPQKLRYELSLFADVAKWLFAQQEEDRTIQVVFSPTDRLPDRLSIVIDDLAIEAEVDMLGLIPSLNSAQANLKLLDDREFGLKSLSFDPKKLSFTLQFAPWDEALTKEAIPYGPWFFFPNRGFISLVQKPKKSLVLQEAKEIAKLFLESLGLLKTHLPYRFQEEPQEVFYQLYFDDRHCLHVEAYLERPGDLDRPIWADWTFIDGQFRKLVPLKFDSSHLVLSCDEIPQFLLANRAWLSQIKGFSVHVAKLQEQILYVVDEHGGLTLSSVKQAVPKDQESLELGNWIYVKNDGFYVKNFTEDNPSLPLGKIIPRHLVADFIRPHYEELETVQDFFAEECPILRVGLSIKLKKKGVIQILPEYEWKTYRDKELSIFYDEFVFVRNRGFFRLPQSFRPLQFVREISADDPQAWSAFFQDLLPRLKEEYTCKVDPRLEKVQDLALTVVPQEGSIKDPRLLSDWELDIYWKTKFGRLSIQELMNAKKRDERFVPTDAGMIDLAEDRFHWLDSLKEQKKGPLFFKPTDFLRLNTYDTIHIETEGIQSRDAFKEILQKLLEQKPSVNAELLSLKSELRPYQKHGVDWLWYLFQNNLSGLLCDDMGVGKTHQAMGLMDAIRNFKRKEKQKSLFLVICPTSLIYHWKDKLERFLPDFKIKIYVNFTRQLDDFPGDYDLFLTSYGIWRNESHKLKKYFFDAAFFDELQIAKNHVSQIHGALLQARSSMKVGLTGTPIENQLRELKALFDLVLPGYMPHESDFREFFIRPIERAENPKRRELLARFVKPFVLRRRKKDVLPELPEKTEEIYVTELATEQKNLYRQIASQQVLPLIQQLRDEGSPIPYMHIFAVLSSLKQICNNPATYLKDVANYERYESGKWEAFVELVEEAMESEQKVVVFSQFLAMLDIIELFCKKNGIGYAQIRGQTKNRGDEVGRFHDDPNCKIFLGSLQAAGLGIDLTAASIVIHYDRWWNAARENQATDRVHRFGQQRGVQVFKLLTKATIEERIDRMIAKKANLLEDVVSFDDHQIVKRLSRQEIILLLEGMPDE